MSGVADPFNGHVDEFRISHVQRSDGWIETTWNNIRDPGAFAAAAAEEQAGNEPHGQRTGHAIIAVGDVLLVAADPIERLRRDDVEPLGCASARSVWMPGRSRLAPEMAWSE